MNRFSVSAISRASSWTFAARCLLLVALTIPVCPAAATRDPEIVVREIFDELLARIETQRQADTLSDESVREIFASLLTPRIDYVSLARWILRDYWTNSSVDQQSEFLQAFEGYIINTYALALANGKKIQLDVKDEPVLRNNTAVVMAAFKVADADAVPLDFRLIEREEKWLLFDVSFSGVSLARTFRSDFNYVAKNGGIDAVTAHLVQRRAGTK
ncbi:MAG: ABC transporter substrate-binding protein [Gammaproteobacteria bacterium]|jgi:phospholipid transport system substrate-binding protein|nr:ABC transporter substrate-binding protein [Gammaproteobacteria bacterium]